MQPAGRKRMAYQDRAFAQLHALSGTGKDPRKGQGMSNRGSSRPVKPHDRHHSFPVVGAAPIVGAVHGPRISRIPPARLVRHPVSRQPERARSGEPGEPGLHLLPTRLNVEKRRAGKRFTGRNPCSPTPSFRRTNGRAEAAFGEQ